MNRSKPQIAATAPAAFAPMTPATQGAGTNSAGQSLSSTFNRFRFAPALGTLNPRTAGRRSLIGGN